jgi:hypothetical protein
MLVALRPGGWLLIEDGDRESAGSVFPADERALCAILSYMERSGFDRRTGGKLVVVGVVAVGAWDAP